MLCRLFFSQTVLRVIGPRTSDGTGLGKLLGVAEEVVAERFGDSEDVTRDKAEGGIGEDMLASFIRHGVDRGQCELEIPFQISEFGDFGLLAMRDEES